MFDLVILGVTISGRPGFGFLNKELRLKGGTLIGISKFLYRSALVCPYLVCLRLLDRKSSSADHVIHGRLMGFPCLCNRPLLNILSPLWEAFADS